jgi:hypothetical protein
MSVICVTSRKDHKVSHALITAKIAWVNVPPCCRFKVLTIFAEEGNAGTRLK